MPAAVPAGGAQGCDPGLEDPRVEGERALPGGGEEDGGQDEAAVDHQAHDHRDHVHPQLPGHHLQVPDGRDLAGDQRGDAHRRVPEHRESLLPCSTPQASQLLIYWAVKLLVS